MNPHNLYIHVPYCASKCNYCAFYSVCTPDWSGYLAGILRDIKYWGNKLSHPTVPTIFFGGGTPSLMPLDVFARIMNAIYENFDVIPDAEITIESNPGTLDKSRVQGFVTAGVNRLSVGVQSLDDNALSFLGRQHTAQDARDLISAAHDLNLRASGDFIYGLPGQSLGDVKKMCRGILDLGLKHASLYELSIDSGTPFSKMDLVLPDNNIMADMYQLIDDELSPNLSRYEVSNYAQRGFECMHNSNVWSGDAYIGIGPAAAGRVYFDGQWHEQGYAPNVKDWMNGNGAFLNAIDNDVRAIEKIITGLRTSRGVKLTPDVRAKTNQDYIEKHSNYFNQSEYFLSLTSDGLLVLNNLLPDLIE